MLIKINLIRSRSIEEDSPLKWEYWLVFSPSIDFSTLVVAKQPPTLKVDIETSVVQNVQLMCKNQVLFVYHQSIMYLTSIDKVII